MDQRTLIINSITFFILKDRNGIMNLLKQAGLVFDENHISNDKLVTMMINSLADNPEFQANYLAYISNHINKQTTFSNALGDVLDSSSSDSTDTGSGGGFSFGDALSLVGSGLSIFGTITASNNTKAVAQAQAQAAMATAQASTQNAQTQLQLVQAQLAAASKTPVATNNTTLYVILGIGAVVILGGIMFMASKK